MAKGNIPAPVPPGITSERPEQVPVDTIQAIVQNAQSKRDVASQDVATDDHRPGSIPPGITDERPESVPVEKIQAIVAEAHAKHEVASEEDEATAEADETETEGHQPGQIPPGITDERPESVPVEKILAIVEEAHSKHEASSEEEELPEDDETTSAATSDDHRPGAIPPGMTAERPESVPVEKILAVVEEAWSKAGHCGAGVDDHGAMADVHLVGVSHLPVDLF